MAVDVWVVLEAEHVVGEREVDLAEGDPQRREGAKPAQRQSTPRGRRRSAAPLARERLAVELQRRARVSARNSCRRSPTSSRASSTSTSRNAPTALDARLVRLVLGGVVVEAVGLRCAAVAMLSPSRAPSTSARRRAWARPRNRRELHPVTRVKVSVRFQLLRVYFTIRSDRRVEGKNFGVVQSGGDRFLRARALGCGLMTRAASPQRARNIDHLVEQDRMAR